VTGNAENGTAVPVGARLKRLRVEAGLSQRDIAGRGVSFTYVSRIESGQRQPSIKALRVLAQRLGVSAEFLETGNEVSAASGWELRLGDAELALRLGDGEGSEERFQALLDEAEAAGDAEVADRARTGYALALTRSGRHADAAALLAVAVGRDRPSVADRPDLYATLGRAYAAAGETPRAVALFRRCLEEIAEAPSPDPVLYVRFATYLSYALTDVGETAAAHEALASALARADGVEDRTTLVRLYWSLSRYYSFEGKPATSLDYIRRAIALLEAGEDTFYLARAHESCATILLDQGNVREAGPHLDLAERMFGELGEPAYVGSARAERARLGVLEGNLDAARAEALAALDLLDRGEAVEVGRTWRTLGDVFDRLGDDDLAERSYRTAAERLVEQGAVKELAETYRTLGKFLRARGREGEALDVYERAADLASRVVSLPQAFSAERASL
jgi:transcriptional regulator with XRE-family HTH domain